MSDTTTITPEERDLWASTAAARINAVTPERQCEITAQERLVNALKALEQAEARAEKAEANVARLTKMVQILSEWCAQFESGHTLEEVGLALSNGMACPEPWQYADEAARRAVADAESSGTVPCPACKGKGGAEYEPGLLSYVCNVCGGTGQIEGRAVAEREVEG